MDAICEEFKLHVVVHDLEDENKHSKFRVNKKNYFGVPEKEAFNVIHLNSFKEHYFLEEKTKYSNDYIKHKYVLHEEVDPKNFNKRFDGGYWKATKDPKRFISSGKLVKLLLENNYFQRMTYNNSKVLETTLYKDAEFEIGDLNYDPKFCTRLIAPKGLGSKCSLKPQDKKTWESFDKEKKEYTYFYADFEADVSKNPHKCYMCCVQSIDGEKKRTYTGEDCDKKFLNFMSYFDNPCRQEVLKLYELF